MMFDFKVALVLPHADLVVCLDGHGGIAAVCPPSELSAALKQSMLETARKNNTNSLSESTRSISSSSGTDSELTYSTATVIVDNSVKYNTSHDKSSSNNNKDMVGDTKKKLTRSESNGFFDLLSALPGMAGTGVEPVPSSLSSSPSSFLSSSGQADDTSSTSFFDTDATGSLDIFNHNNNESRNKNEDVLVRKEKEKVEGIEKHKIADKSEDRHSKEINSLMTLKEKENKQIIKKNVDSSDEGDEINVPHQSAALLVEKETKSAGTIGVDVYWFYVKSGGGVAAVLLVAISNIFLPSAW